MFTNHSKQTSPAAVDLRALAGDIQFQHGQIRRLHGKALEAARDLGGKLLQAREACRTKGFAWLKWQKDNLPFTRSKAADYIRIAERWEEVQDAGSINRALKILSPPDEVRNVVPHYILHPPGSKSDGEEVQDAGSINRALKILFPPTAGGHVSQGDMSHPPGSKCDGEESPPAPAAPSVPRTAAPAGDPTPRAGGAKTAGRRTREVIVLPPRLRKLAKSLAGKVDDLACRAPQSQEFADFFAGLKLLLEALADC